MKFISIMNIVKMGGVELFNTTYEVGGSNTP